jgi:hypothetical protein
MAKIVRLTESDLTRLVNRILKEDVKVEVEPSKEPSKEDSNEYFEDVLRDGNFKQHASEEVLYNYYSARPNTKPNLTCDFSCRKDRFKYCNPENGYQITITFNRKVNELNGFWSNKQEPGPLVELDKLMGGHDYNFNNGITKMIQWGLSSEKARDILRKYNNVKF